jgi:hypothetical protein
MQALIASLMMAKRQHATNKQRALECAESSYSTPEFLRQLSAAEAEVGTFAAGAAIEMAAGSKVEGKLKTFRAVRREEELAMAMVTQTVRAEATLSEDGLVVSGADPSCTCGVPASMGKPCGCLVLLRNYRVSTVNSASLTPHASRATTYKSQYPGDFPLPNLDLFSPGCLLEKSEDAKQPLLLCFPKGSKFSLEGKRGMSSDDHAQQAAKKAKLF